MRSQKLAELAVCAGLGDNSQGAEALAEAFISAIEKMNLKHGIPEYIPEIKEEDIGELSRYAAKEANPLYPVPKLWNAHELELIYRKVMKSNGKTEIQKLLDGQRKFS